LTAHLLRSWKCRPICDFRPRKTWFSRSHYAVVLFKTCGERTKYVRKIHYS